MDKFKGFTEAAILYAENVPVIEAMRLAMAENVHGLFDAVRSEAKKLLQTEVHEQRRGGYCDWWLAQTDEKKDWRPWLTFKYSPPDPTIVRPGAFSFVVSVDGLATTDQQKQAICQIESEAEFKEHILERSMQDYALLSCQISYESQNPVESTAPIIAKLLQRIKDAWENTASASLR